MEGVTVGVGLLTRRVVTFGDWFEGAGADTEARVGVRVLVVPIDVMFTLALGAATGCSAFGESNWVREGGRLKPGRRG